jgi:hypothetical protein
VKVARRPCGAQPGMQKPQPAIVPMPLLRVPEPFDDPDRIFELKLDGFRALAYVERGTGALIFLPRLLGSSSVSRRKNRDASAGGSLV